MNRLQNIPAFKFALLFAAGILIGSTVQFNLIFLIIFLIVLIILGFYFLKIEPGPILKFGLITLAVISAGIYKANIDNFTFPKNTIKNIPSTAPKTNYELIAVVKEMPDYDSTRVRFVADAVHIVTRKDSIPVKGEVMVTVWKNKFDKDGYSAPELRPGDKISLLGRLDEARDAKNPGEFNYRRYLELHGIHRVFTVSGYENVILVSHNNLGFIEQHVILGAKQYAVKNIDTYIKGDAGAYLKALVTGDRSSISREIREAFINTGAMHLLAVSGLNVAYIILILAVVLSLFRVPKIPAFIITVIILLFYCAFTGGSASIIRATVMGVLFIAAVYIERKPDFYNLAGAAAILILMVDSRQLYDAGFILSFTAVIMMVYIYEKFDSMFLHKISHSNIYFNKALTYLVILFFTTVAANIGVLPLAAMFFGRISFISFLSNLVAVPLSNLSLALGLLQVTIGIFSGFLSSIVAAFNELLLMGQLAFISWCASLSFSYIDFYKFDLISTVAYFIIIFIILNIKKKNIVPRLVICVLIAFIAVTFNSGFKNNKLKISFIEAGGADCTLIQTPDGRNILINAGSKTGLHNSGVTTIAPFLKRSEINNIDLLILTGTADGLAGGAAYLINNFRIGAIIYSSIQGMPSDVREAANNKNIPAEEVSSGDKIDDINSLRIYFLGPVRFGDKITSKNTSVVVKLKYKDTEYLFPGNTEQESGKILAYGYNGFLKAAVLKPGNTAFGSDRLINFTKPGISVLNTGNGPDDRIAQTLESAGGVVHSLELNGALLLESDGYSINKINWK